MAKAFLRAKTELLLDGAPYIVDRQCSDGVWVLRHQNTERAIELTTDQVFDAYAVGTITFQDNTLRSISNPRQRDQKAPRKMPVNISSVVLDAAKIRMAYVRAIVGLPYSQKRVEQAIGEVWDGLVPQPATKPGWTSVYRWSRAYLDSSESPASLLDAHAEKGNREPRFAKEILEICEGVLDSDYLTLERPTIEHVTNLARALTRAENKLLPESCQLAMPTSRLMARLIGEIPAYDQHAARYGRESARKKYRTVLRHRQTDAPLQRGEMDHTRMNVFAIDDVHGLPLGRPWLTVLIDDFTRCLLGFCLSFEPPSRATVARCLRHAFLPKTKLREEYPDLKNDWAAFGIVSELVLDGGLEFHSKELENICFELNIEQHFSPRKTPWFKGKIERFQGTLNRGVTASTPGKTFDGILERDDYDPKLHAVVTMSALRHVVIRWIVDVYHQKPHSALGCSPAQMWAQSVRVEDIPLMDDPLRFDAIVGGAEHRVLSHKGIEYAGLQYNSPEMTDLRRYLGDTLRVDIRIDRSNLGSVIVLHPERGTPYRVPCLRPDYAEGLTEWQHNVCKRYAKEKNQAGADVDAWLDSLLEISEIVRREMGLGRKKGVTRERIARWSEGKQVIPEADAKQVINVSPARPEPVTPIPIAKVVDQAVPLPVSPTFEVPKATRKRLAPIFEERKQFLPAKSLTDGGIADD
jgi:putative transposase